jgi:hypothetical protein
MTQTTPCLPHVVNSTFTAMPDDARATRTRGERPTAASTAMYFRHRGSSVQIIRAERDPATGKAKPKPVGSFSKDKLDVPAKLREQLSAEEIQSVQGWIEAYRPVDALKNELAARTLAETIEAASNWLEQAEPAEARVVVGDVLTAWQRLRRVLAAKNLV